jgi:hypothetical protein
VTWTWNAIRENWPQVVDLAYSADTIVDAFNRVERVLGPEAIEHSGPHRGTYPVLSIVCDGRRLSALDGVERTDAFVRGLARGDVSSWTELEALYILRPARTRPPRTSTLPSPSGIELARLTSAFAGSWTIRGRTWRSLGRANPRPALLSRISSGLISGATAGGWLVA